MPEYSIREARPDDIESIFEIELECFKNPWRFENYISEFKLHYAYITVAEHQNTIIGFTDLWLVADEIHLNKIAVCEAYRRQGVANALIDYIISKFENIGMRIIFLEVRERNIGARNFYKKLGFQENGIRKKYYSDDNAILIEKVL